VKTKRVALTDVDKKIEQIENQLLAMQKEVLSSCNKTNTLINGLLFELSRLKKKS